MNAYHRSASLLQSVTVLCIEILSSFDLCLLYPHCAISSGSLPSRKEKRKSHASLIFVAMSGRNTELRRSNIAAWLSQSFTSLVENEDCLS
jgi:hypothetical protein